MGHGGGPNHDRRRNFHKWGESIRDEYHNHIYKIISRWMSSKGGNDIVRKSTTISGKNG